MKEKVIFLICSIMIIAASLFAVGCSGGGSSSSGATGVVGSGE